jgi:hypothetical protein
MHRTELSHHRDGLSARTRCGCNRVRQGSAYTRDQCRECWLIAHDPAYRALLGPLPARSVGGGDGCRFLGDATGDTWSCPSCRGGQVRLKVYHCAHPAHPLVTLAHCRECPDKEPQSGESL